MEVLDRLLERRPDGLLYHYTSQIGLLSIIDNCEIWATDIRYLNDASEFRLACQLAVEVIDERIAQAPDERRKQALMDMRGAAGEAGINVCVASFSEKGDLLSQWRAYGNATSGFSLGFTYDALKAATAEDRWIITPCLYKRREQLELMRELVDDALAKILDERDRPRQERVRVRGGNMGYYLNRYAAIFKDSSFAEESEWRLISPPLNCTLPRYAYRPGKSTITPYYRFPLAKDERGRLMLKEVVIGPSPHPELAESGAFSFLVNHDLHEPPLAPGQGVKVLHSAVPYRNW